MTVFYSLYLYLFRAPFVLKNISKKQVFFPGWGGGGGIRECAKNLFLPATNPVAFKTGGYVILTAYRMQPARAGGSQPLLYKVFKSFCRIQNTCIEKCLGNI